MAEAQQTRHRRRRTFGWVIGGALLVLALLILGWFAYLIAEYIITENTRSRELAAEPLDEWQPADRTPRWSPDGRYIIANLGDSIYRVSMPGGEVKPILEGGRKTGQYSPTLSSDGQIMYLDRDRGKSTGGNPRITDTEGQRPLELDIDHLRNAPKLSPDGDHIFYTHAVRAPGVEDQPQAIHETLQAQDGGPDISWPILGDAILASAWSPDSQYIALVNYIHEGEPEWILTLVRREDAERLVITQRDTAGGLRRLSEPGWTSDNTLYYVGNEPEGETTHSILFRVDVDGGDHREVINLTTSAMSLIVPYEATASPGMLNEVHRVIPSPGGDKVLFAADATEIDTGRQWLASLVLWTVGERTLTLLPSGGWRLHASWSPDGEWIAIVDPFRGQLRVTDSEGGDARVLFDEKANP